MQPRPHRSAKLTEVHGRRAEAHRGTCPACHSSEPSRSVPVLPACAHRSVPTALLQPAAPRLQAETRIYETIIPAQRPHCMWRTSVPVAPGPAPPQAAPSLGEPAPPGAPGTYLLSLQGLRHLWRGPGAFCNCSCSLCRLLGLVSPRIRLRPLTPVPQNVTASGPLKK